MTGTYVVRIPRYPARNVTWESRSATARIEGEWRESVTKAWRIFVHTCKSLAADKLEYTVSLQLTGEDPRVVIQASGTPTHAKVRTVRHGIPLPAMLTIKRIEQEIAARRYYLPENWAENRRRQVIGAPKIGNRPSPFYNLGANELRAELEYWEELERLTHQREHFKPGIVSDEQLYQDDEVAA